MIRYLLACVLAVSCISCEESPSPPATQEPPKQKTEPVIATVPAGMLLTRDLAGKTPSGFTFEMYKVDLPEGSFGLQNGMLHRYAGHTVWNNIESELSNDPWKRALKARLQEMLAKHQIYEEGVVYKFDGNVEDSGS